MSPRTIAGATIVFVGPTLPASEVAARLAGAIVAPPVGVGDVLALVQARRRPARIAIIDGYFEHMAAVWHKELLLAIERGIEVWGAASMGALRAAELAPFGMRGVGAIYRDYARGRLTADDEVAVAHLPGELGFRPTGDPLVNLRAGVAVVPGLSARSRAALVDLARARHYRERSWRTLLADGRTAGLPARQLARLAGAIAAGALPDQKAADARALLRALARTGPPTPRAATRARGLDLERLRVPRTWALRQLERIVSARR